MFSDNWTEGRGRVEGVFRTHKTGPPSFPRTAPAGSYVAGKWPFSPTDFFGREDFRFLVVSSMWSLGYSVMLLFEYGTTMAITMYAKGKLSCTLLIDTETLLRSALFPSKRKRLAPKPIKDKRRNPPRWSITSSLLDSTRQLYLHLPSPFRILLLTIQVSDTDHTNARYKQQYHLNFLENWSTKWKWNFITRISLATQLLPFALKTAHQNIHQLNTSNKPSRSILRAYFCRMPDFFSCTKLYSIQYGIAVSKSGTALHINVQKIRPF